MRKDIYHIKAIFIGNKYNLIAVVLRSNNIKLSSNFFISTIALNYNHATIATILFEIVIV